MAIPPYMLPPAPWAAQLMVQQQAFAAAQAQQQAQMHAHQMANQIQQIPPPGAPLPPSAQIGHIPTPKPEIITEEKLQEKGCNFSFFFILFQFFLKILNHSSKMGPTTVKEVR